MYSKHKRKSKLLCLLLAMLIVFSVIPLHAFAAPASDILKDMLNNDYLDALAYTGYDVQTLKDDGRIFKKYGSALEGTAVLSGIGYDSSYRCSGLEKNSAGVPDIAKFRQNRALLRFLCELCVF